MNDLAKNGFKLIGIHALGVLITYVLMAFFSFITNLFVFSIISGIVYFWLLYMAAWHDGKKAGRPRSGVNASIKVPLKSSIIPSIIPLIFIILILTKVWAYSDLLINIWYCMFLGFFKEITNVTVLNVLLSGLVLPIATVVGYTLGSKNISFSENFNKSRRTKRDQLLKEKEERIRLYKENNDK